MRHRRRRPPQVAVAILLLIIGIILSQIERKPQPKQVEHIETGSFSGRVVGVSDGDTIRVMHNGREVKVRLYGIDAPEKRQDFGMAAKKYASLLVFGKTVTVDSRGTDRYGRTIGWVNTGNGVVLNEEMVKAGLAWWYREYAPNDNRLSQLEAQARNARRGLWSRSNPTPPWEYRRQRRNHAIAYCPGIRSNCNNCDFTQARHFGDINSRFALRS